MHFRDKYSLPGFEPKLIIPVHESETFKNNGTEILPEPIYYYYFFFLTI